MKVRSYEPRDSSSLTQLIAAFRVALAELKGPKPQADLAAAARELAEYVEKGFPLFVAEDEESNVVGYLVCRVEDGTVWADSLYVRPELRRKGVASALYAEAERLASQAGSETVYNWVHPNNDAILSFLKERGYNVLNLVEIRRARPKDGTGQKIRVGEHEFTY